MMKPNDLERSRLEARRILITGSVQGIGFRPALARLAVSLDLKGSIANTPHGVELHLEGDVKSLDEFASECAGACPANGVLEHVMQCEAEFQYCSELILNASEESTTLRTCIPLDRICCTTCINEVLEKGNKRFGYLLNSCSDCGPRYTLIKSMPFERVNTTLQSFSICESCKKEYESVRDRRFHTQGIVCPQCGPQFHNVERITEHLRAGQIVAIKGIGGYQCLALATSPAAIEHLRSLKNRPMKPFVVMVSNIMDARRIGTFSALEMDLLHSEAGPIVIVERTESTQTLTEHSSLDLSPTMGMLTSGLDTIGIMLPSIPLHSQLVRQLGPLIVTSANRDGDPMITSDTEMQECGLVTDERILGHDREIVRHADDSIVRVIAGRATTLRLGRGLGPLVLSTYEQGFDEKQWPEPNILAVGGHQKVAIALSNGYQAILGPHLGDMESLKFRERFIQHVRDLLNLYGCKPQIIVHDLNPDYFTTRWAQEFALELGVTTLGVQHHHAHVASGLWETNWLNRRILGFAWDGTGYGSDKSIWGGEVFHGAMAHARNPLDRVATLYPFRLPGGEQAIQEPERIAESLLWETYGADIPVEPIVPNRLQIQNMIRGSTFAPQTTSVGRLFDGVAALVWRSIQYPKAMRDGYEGYWAMQLESICSRKQIEDESTGQYDIPLASQQMPSESERKAPNPLVLDWRPLIRGIVDDTRNNIESSIISLKFHRALANTIVLLGQLHQNSPILLTGGAFQNKVLVELIDRKCHGHDLEWSMPRDIPINDGGLAAGQLLIGLTLTRGLLCA